jgi:hypothetical protein
MKPQFLLYHFPGLDTEVLPKAALRAKKVYPAQAATFRLEFVQNRKGVTGEPR